MNSSAYWKNKCELCKFAQNFSTRYGLYWECSKDRRGTIPMYAVKEDMCPNGRYYPIERDKQFDVIIPTKWKLKL